MALTHATPGQAIDIRPLAHEIPRSVTTTLIKTDQIEVIRLVVPAGKAIALHKVTGTITVQCLEGLIEFSALDRTVELQAGQMLYLTGGAEHSVKGIEDASVLLTILL